MVVEQQTVLISWRDSGRSASRAAADSCGFELPERQFRGRPVWSNHHAPPRPRPAGCDAESLGLAPSEPRRGPAGDRLRPLALKGGAQFHDGDHTSNEHAKANAQLARGDFVCRWTIWLRGRPLCSLPPTIGRQELVMTRA